jgi:glycosyltransferase involved in cell wall biosynthesis
MTVHDLSVYHAPSAYTLGQRIRLMYFNRLAAQRAALVIVPSHAVAKDCQTFWNINPQKICVVPHGYYAGTSLPKMDSPTPTVLFVGRVEKKKNLSVVMKAWELVQPKHPFKLIIAGGPGYGWKSIYHQSRIVAQKYPERIVFTGRITEDARRRYMASAWALVVPSPYEGFGLPVLEGFDAKTPVICAEAGSLPEVGGKAVLYADPYDEQQWAKQIEQLIENPEKRRQLRRLGTERLRHYRWEVSAKETALAILKTIDQR